MECGGRCVCGIILPRERVSLKIEFLNFVGGLSATFDRAEFPKIFKGWLSYMTWETMAALITIVGSLITLGGVLTKLVNTLTKLDATINYLKNDVDRLREGNHESHRRIYARLDELEHR